MKKAQASTDYISTFAYSALAIIIVMGAMGYLGMFNSSTYAKESCESGEQISCADAEITTDGVIGVMLTNNHDRSINITNYTLYYEGKEFFVDNANIIIDPNDNGTIDFDTSGMTFNKGKKESFDYTLSYIPEGSTLSIQLSGTATTKVKEEILNVCGNEIIEVGEECDEGNSGGEIPTEVYSCENYLLSHDNEITKNNIQNYKITGHLRCNPQCTAQLSSCNYHLVCDGCYNFEHICIDEGLEGYSTTDKLSNDDLDMCSSTGWVDCGDTDTNLCPINSQCDIGTNECIPVCDGCIDNLGECITVGETGDSEYYEGLDYCAEQGYWRDCTIDNRNTCNHGEQCDNGYCTQTTQTCGNNQLDTAEECDYYYNGNLNPELLGNCLSGACNPDCTCPNTHQCVECEYNNTCYDNNSIILIFGFEETCGFNKNNDLWMWNGMNDIP